MRCQPYGKIFPIAYGNPLMVSAHLVQPFPSPHTSLCTPDTLSCFSLQNNSFLPWGPCRHGCFFFFFPCHLSFHLSASWGPPLLLLPAFGDSKPRPYAENMSFSVTSKAVWVSGRTSRRNQRGVSRYFGYQVPLISVSVRIHRRCGLGRAKPAAGCHGHFITHLLIVANGDFMPPPALIVAAALL